jgi:MFS family permease
MMGSSLTAGRVMRRTGRYRTFPIVGTGIATVGSLLFATLSADTPIWQVMAYMVVMGIGLGMSMQMLMVAAQNALPPQDMGLSTATTTFFRSMGATFGAAVSLAVLFSTVLGNIRERMVDAHVPTAFLDHVNADSLDNTGKLLNLLPPDIQHLVLSGFADSMRTVFLVMAITMVPAFIGTWFVKEEPLREHSAMEMMKHQEEAAAL